MAREILPNDIPEIKKLLNLALQTEEYTDIKLRHCLKNSKMLSSDVTAAYDPNRPNPFNKNIVK